MVRAFIERLEAAGVQVCMDGRGRCLDSIFIEHLWRRVKREDVYLRGHESVSALERGLTAYFWFHNQERPYQSLDYRAPAKVHAGQKKRPTTE